MSCAAFNVSAIRVTTTRRCCKLVARAAHVEVKSSRREAILAAGASLALIAPSSALAFLGFGEDVQKQYTDDTGKLLSTVNAVLAMDGDKEQAVNSLKRDMNSWTAKYRRNDAIGNRPSFGNMYSAINALAGHWNNFGPDAPVPKKRFARIAKELEDVDKLLARGR